MPQSMSHYSPLLETFLSSSDVLINDLGQLFCVSDSSAEICICAYSQSTLHYGTQAYEMELSCL